MLRILANQGTEPVRPMGMKKPKRLFEAKNGKLQVADSIDSIIFVNIMHCRRGFI